MAISHTSLKGLKPEAKPYKVFDTQGLFILINPSGSKLWRFQYSFKKKRKLMALGSFPAVSLADARQKRDEARNLLSDGKDPSEIRKVQKRAEGVAEKTTFERVTEEWVSRQAWSERYRKQVFDDLKRHMFKDLGARPLAEIKPRELLDCLRKVEAAGHLCMVKHLRSRCSNIFRFGVVSSYCESDPASLLNEAFKRHTVTHMATITRERLPELLRAMDNHPCEPTTHAALMLLPMLFLRAHELTGAMWTEFDWEKALWEVPTIRMKKKRDHLVPLPRQAVAVLMELREITGDKPHVFYSWRTKTGYIGTSTPLNAIQQMGFHGVMTQHGFRALARTTMSELRSEGLHSFTDEAISQQLSHKKKDQLAEAYDRSELLKERTAMMQWWADYLEEQRKL